MEQAEKARRTLLKKIECFEGGIEFITENYIVKEPFFSMKVSSLKWLEDVKSAINNIDLKNNKIGGKTVPKTVSEQFWILSEYLGAIKHPIMNEFGWNNSIAINKMIDAYSNKLYDILIK